MRIYTNVIFGMIQSDTEDNKHISQKNPRTLNEGNTWDEPSMMGKVLLELKECQLKDSLRKYLMAEKEQI